MTNQCFLYHRIRYTTDNGDEIEHIPWIFQEKVLQKRNIHFSDSTIRDYVQIKQPSLRIRLSSKLFHS